MKDELSYDQLEDYLYEQGDFLYLAEPTYNTEKPRCVIHKPFDDVFAEEALPVIGDFFIDDDEENC